MKQHYAILNCGVALAMALGCAVETDAAGIPAYFRQVGMKRAPRREAPASVMRPSKEEVYMMEDAWVLIGELSYEYDSRGNQTRIVVNEAGDVNSIEIAYNEYDQVVSRLDREGEDGQYMSRRTYEYDPIVHDFCVHRMGYDWDGYDWTPNYFCETNEVTRDADGNVTAVMKSLPYNLGDMVPAYRSQWGYGADKKANTYAYYMNMQPQDVSWILYDDTEYRDITWDRTDGQLMGELIDMVISDPTGTNRFSSATAYYEGEPDGYVFATYPAGDELGFRLSYTTNNPEEVGIVQELVLLDADTFGYSYRLMEYFYEETDEITTEPVYTMESVYIADSYGNPAAERIYEEYLGGERELVAGHDYKNTYDDAGNLIEVVESEYDYDSQEYFLTQRTVYSDYTDVTSGVDEVAARDNLRINGSVAYADGMIAVFTADGVRVAEGKESLDLSTLAKGIYILRSGRSSLKIIL